MIYVCSVCGYEYNEAEGDQEHGIAPGTKFADLPADFECPLCGVGKDEFEVKELYFLTALLSLCMTLISYKGFLL